MWALPAFDSSGNAISNPTPVKFGVLQDLTLSVEYTAKELFSRFQLPIAAARAGAKISWSAKYAQINATLFHSIFFGNTGAPTAGALTIADTEVTTVPTTPFNRSPVNIATMQRDLGVRYSATGNPLQLSLSTPATGSYVFANVGLGAWTALTPYVLGQQIKPTAGQNAGGFVYQASVAGTSGASTPAPFNQTVGNNATSDSGVTWLNVGLPGSYLFATGDSTVGVWLDYVYQPTFGWQTTFTSQALGNAPVFGIIARGVFLGAPMTWRLDNCVSNKLTIPRKVDDWTILQMDGEAFVGSQGSGTAGFISVNEAL